LQSFNISEHFAWVWQAFALALAAWECQAWDLANKCFAYALSEAKTNPVINQALADYIVEKARVSANAEVLHILTHKPALYSPEKSDQEVHEDQISIAGRYLSAAEMLPALKIGQAVFTGRWDNEDELKAYIKTSRQAAQLLSVQLSDETIDTICAAFPEDFEVQFQAALQILYRNPDLCAQKASELIEKAPRNPCLYALQALASQAEPERAVEAMEKALEIWPDEPDWHAIAGALYEQQEHYDLAAQHLEEALRIQPKHAHYWQMLGDIKVLEKDYHAARDYFSKAIELFPDNAEALSALAVINQQLGEYQAAIACLKQAEQLDPENKFYAQQIAECYLALKDYSAALEQAERALQADPRSISALLTKIKALIGKRQFDQARSNLQAARKLVTDTIPFDLLEIELESTVSKKSGLAACLALAEAYPDNVDVLNNLAYYYLEAGMQNQAEETLYRSLAIDPHNAYTLLSLGRIDRKRGNLDQALAHLSQAIAINPSLIEAYLEMGKTYQDRRDVEKALETYRHAIDMVEKDPRAYVLAAAAYKESRDYQNAEYMLRQAAELSPNDPIIRRQLASIVALNLVNNLQEAPKRR
jgi:tetratricopeptide (TPR) repeat protein